MSAQRTLRQTASRTLMLTGGCLPFARDGRYAGRVLWGPGRGMKLTFNLLDHPALLLGRYEPHVVAAMRRHIRAGSTVYDIGANIGYLTALAARLAGTGHVVAFEPDPANAELLQRNIRQNRLANVEVEPRAVTCDGRPIQLATYAYSLVNHIVSGTQPAASDARVLTGESVALDTFVYEEGHQAPGVIKIDVEGAEREVLAGAERVLREARPVVVAETRASEWGAISGQMKAARYRWEFLGERRDFSAHDVADILFVPE